MYNLELIYKIGEGIEIRCIKLNAKVFIETNKMLEKCDVVGTNKPGGGAEHKLRDGIGWTKVVFLKFGMSCVAGS